MEKTLKSFVLAGIGTIAYGYEKGAAIIEEMVKKGEISIEQGKELREELKKKINKASSAGSETYKDILGGLNVATKQEFEEYKAAMQKEIEELKEKISQLENKVAE